MVKVKQANLCEPPGDRKQSYPCCNTIHPKVILTNPPPCHPGHVQRHLSSPQVDPTSEQPVQSLGPWTQLFQPWTPGPTLDIRYLYRLQSLPGVLRRDVQHDLGCFADGGVGGFTTQQADPRLTASLRGCMAAGRGRRTGAGWAAECVL